MTRMWQCVRRIFDTKSGPIVQRPSRRFIPMFFV